MMTPPGIEGTASKHRATKNQSREIEGWLFRAAPLLLSSELIDCKRSLRGEYQASLTRKLDVLLSPGRRTRSARTASIHSADCPAFATPGQTPQRDSCPLPAPDE